jgi:acetyl esterase/lipase
MNPINKKILFMSKTRNGLYAVLIGFLILGQTQFLLAAGDPDFTQSEVIYGRKDGMALTFVMLAPKANANGKGIIYVLSGGWHSGDFWIPFFQKNAEIYISRGYTVFGVMHSSAPRYNILDAIPEIHRAVRFIRYHAADYKIDPGHLGITGHSAGAHLSLMIATADDVIDSVAKDPVDRVSSRVQAIACFYPPTDFLNWGKPGINSVVDKSILIRAGARPSFDFTDWDSATGHSVLITDPLKLTAIYKQISPIYQISSDDPPVMIVHGDGDLLVPIQQSESIIRQFQRAGVPTKFLIKKGAGHGIWPDENQYEKSFADWFDQYLK